jgi:hypothetical protein
MRRKSRYIGEVQVECHQASGLGLTRAKYGSVGRPAKLFLADRLDIVTVVAKQLLRPISEIFVQLELHAALEPGRST